MLESDYLPANETWCSGCAWDQKNCSVTTCAGIDSYRQRHYMRIKQIEESVRGGCWTCRLFLAAVERLWVPDDPDFKTNPGELYIRFDAERFTIQSQVRHPPIHIYCVAGRPQIYRFIGGTHLPTKASSEETYQFIRGCLIECLKTHSLCLEAGQSLNDKEWPRRILAINPLSSQVKLVDFDASMDQRYIALSYCWGPSAPSLRASLSTLHELESGVSISQLPRTLADAVQFSIKLGSNLIWIDALCIIQDDPSDWEKESCKMSTVYRHALLTIVASCASSSEEGFLDKKRDAPVLLYKADLGNGQWTEIFARKLPKAGYHRPYRYERGCDHRCLEPVDSRGWTLQEKLLSPRTVTFTGDEVQWECRDTRCCECKQPPTGRGRGKNLEHQLLSPVDEWFETLEDYTTRRLSKNADRLVALSGISKMMSHLLHAQYAAGVWITPEPTLLTVKGLLWKKMRDITQPSFLPDEYLAPSFSWASIVGEVIHVRVNEYRSPSYLARILKVNIIPRTLDPFGSVSRGVLKIEGKLLKTMIKCKKGEPRWKIPPKTEVTLKGSYLYIDVPLERVSLGEGDFTVQRRISADLEESELMSDTEFPETEVVFLPLVVGVKDEYVGPMIFGLVLGKRPTIQGYQRLGMLEISSKDVDPLEQIAPETILLY